MKKSNSNKPARTIRTARRRSSHAVTFATKKTKPRTSSVKFKPSSRAACAEEIAILSKAQHGDIVASYLTRGYAASPPDGSDALTDSFVGKLVALIAAVGNPRDGQALLKVLFANEFGIATADAYRLARALERDTTLLDIFTTPGKLAELSEATETRPAIVFNDPEKLKIFAEKFLAWTAASHEITLTELAERLAAESGLSAAIVEKKAYGSAEAIAALTSFVRNFEVNHPIDSAATGIPEYSPRSRRVGENFAIRLPSREINSVD
jgi:superfamily I DNA/RNA helicase